MRRELPSRQTAVLTLACMLPTIILLFVRAWGGGLSFFEREGASMFFQAALPIVPLFFSVAAFHEDFEQRTIVYLLTRPPTRLSYVIAKFLTAWTCSMFAIGSGIVLLAFTSLWGHFDQWKYFSELAGYMLVAAFFGTAVYSSLFLIFGLSLKNPVLFGLIFTAGWEELVALLPGKLQYWTIGLYTKSIFIISADADPQHFFPSAFKSTNEGPSLPGAAQFFLASTDFPMPGVTRSIITLAAIAVALIGLAVMLFQRREDA